MVAAAFIAPSISPPSPRMQFVDRNGMLTGPALNFLENIHSTVYGLVPILACNASGTNLITLTPVNISPVIQNYISFLGVAFVAAAESTGAVTARLALPAGDLATVPVYIDRGSAQANALDVQLGLFYVMYFVDVLNSGNGGFVIQ